MRRPLLSAALPVALLFPALGTAAAASDWWIEYVPTNPASPLPLAFRRVDPDSIAAVVVDRRERMDSVRLHVWRGGAVVDLGAVPCKSESGKKLEAWAKSRPDRWVVVRPYLGGAYLSPAVTQGYVDVSKVRVIRRDGLTSDGKEIWRLEGPGGAFPNVVFGGVVEGTDRLQAILAESAPR
jgi:hypothetical protein